MLGLEGWQWLFIGQGLPAIAVGFWVLRALPSSPAEASWLAADEREALERELAAESAAREARQAFTLRDALTDRRILQCAAVYFTINFASYGTIFWFADIIERIGDVEGIELGLLAGHPDGARLGRADRDRAPLGPQRRPPPLGRDRDAARRRRPGRHGAAAGRGGVVTLGVCAFGLLGAIPRSGRCPPRCSPAARRRAASP